MQTWAAIIASVLEAIKKASRGIALWFAYMSGVWSEKRKALEEHAKRIEIARNARADGERNGLRDEDFRD